MILLCMALSAVAFGTGLYVQAGVGVAASAIGGVVIFLVMAASQSAFARAQGQSALIDRVGALEASFNALAHDFRQSGAGAGVENSKELQAVAARIEGLKKFVDQADQLGPLAEAASQVRRLSSEQDRLSARFEAFKSQVSIEAQQRDEEMKSEFTVLETLVKQMAERLAAGEETRQRTFELASNAQARAAGPEALSPPGGKPAPAAQPDPPDEAGSASSPAREDSAPAPRTYPEPASMAPRRPAAEPPPEPQEDPEAVADRWAEQAAAVREDKPSPPAHEIATPERNEAAEAYGSRETFEQPCLDEEQIESLMMEEVRRSIEANKIELYLQPIVMLPQRRVRYYEALTRLKSDSGRVLTPGDYLHLAESGGYMPVIDNVMLFRSVQVLRRLEQRSNARGVFCNISVHSLLDPEFFSEFVSFMEQNRNLADSMYFEFSQPVIENCGAVEFESLSALSALGFRFSLDQVTNLKTDFQTLHQRGFRTIKIGSDIFLHGMAEAGASIHPADMRSYLERFGMQLIVEKIEDETSLADVLDHNVRLGQGYLFSEPRPVRPEVFGGNKAEAA